MRVLPILKLLMSEWVDRLEDDKYKPVHNTLKAGIHLMLHIYSMDYSVQFICLYI